MKTRGGSIFSPPAMRTLPSESRVAEWNMRGVVMLPVAMNVPGVCASIVGALPPATSKRESNKLASRDTLKLIPVDFQVASS